MKVNKQLAHDAKKKGICEEWFARLMETEDKGKLVNMYLEGIDFCLSNEYPSNEFIRRHFVGTCEAYGVFLDRAITAGNFRHVVALGHCEGTATYDGWNVGQVFVKHQSRLKVLATGNSFVMIDVFDDTIVEVEARDNAKICVNNYGGNLTTTTGDGEGHAIIKVIRKTTKTY